MADGGHDEVPPSDDDAMADEPRVSAAAAIAAVVGPDGTLRVEHVTDEWLYAICGLPPDPPFLRPHEVRARDLDKLKVRDEFIRGVASASGGYLPVRVKGVWSFVHPSRTMRLQELSAMKKAYRGLHRAWQLGRTVDERHLSSQESVAHTERLTRVDGLRRQTAQRIDDEERRMTVLEAARLGIVRKFR